jgi:hypothetical protein
LIELAEKSRILESLHTFNEENLLFNNVREILFNPTHDFHFYDSNASKKAVDAKMSISHFINEFYI